jgi:hypothetical protein
LGAKVIKRDQPFLKNSVNHRGKFSGQKVGRSGAQPPLKTKICPRVRFAGKNITMKIYNKVFVIKHIFQQINFAIKNCARSVGKSHYIRYVRYLTIINKIG